MNLLFCNEGPLLVDEFGNYYSGALNNAFFEKYYDLADEITICIRIRKITHEEAEKRFSKIEMSNKRIVEIPNLLSGRGFLFRTKAKKILNQEIEKADYVVARVPSVAGNMAATIAHEKRKICIVDVVGCAWDSLFNHSFKGKLLAGPMFIAQKKTVKNADYAIYVTQEFLQKRYPTKGMYVGISDVMLETAQDCVIEKRLEKIKQHQGKIKLGTTAAINVKYKGQDKVIKTLGLLKKKGINNFVYYLAGAGGQDYLKKIAIENEVSDEVIFCGPISHEKIFEWLDSIDVYIQPSFQEGLSRAVIEAMSRGLPCIVSDVGGNPELINEKWIYNRKKTNVMLERKLLALNTEEMLCMANENFSKAKQFDLFKLNKKRKEFFLIIKEQLKKRYGEKNV